MSSLIKRFASIVFATGLWAVGAGAAFAADPQQVGSTLEGCRNNGTITLPRLSDGKFICPDAAYTTGNLGKGWSELDLVPYRITLKAGNSAPLTQTYTIAVVLDYEDGGKPGYDVISAPERNVGKSDASCKAPTVAPIGVGGALDIPGLGGISKSIFRLVTIEQARGSTCVYDYYGRLALGSRQFPGSSLHGNLALPVAGDNDGGTSGGSGVAVDLNTAGIGASDVSIPVKEIEPQRLRKDMSATADGEVQWNLTKVPDPGSLNFGNICAKPAGPQSQNVTFRIEWEKKPATAGMVTAITNIYAFNPASRTVSVQVTDKIYAGDTATGSVLDTATSGLVEVLAGKEVKVLTHTALLSPSDLLKVGGYVNDVATATYIDQATGIEVPGTKTATAVAQIGSGTVSGGFAAIADVESITSGLGLTYTVVAQPSIGTFTNVTPTSDEWGITGQNLSGGVSLVKTVTLDDRRDLSDKSVKITDTATLVASPGTFSKTVGPIDVGVTSSAAVKLTLSKRIPASFTLDTGERIEVAFKITRSGDANYMVEKTLTFGPGDTFKEELVGEGLTPDIYTVEETSALFFASAIAVGQPAKMAPIGGTQKSIRLTAGDDGIFQNAECAGTIAFENAVTGDPVRAQVQKITTPALQLGNTDYLWTFTLTGPGLPTGGVTADAGAGAGFVQFGASLIEGTYTVTETLKSAAGQPWLLTAATPGANGVCQFTVDLPEDGGKIFSCTFNNLKYGKAKVIKTVSGQVPPASCGNLTPCEFTFELRQGASVTQVGSTIETGKANAGNQGVIAFAAFLKPEDTYQLCERVFAGWQSSLGSFVPGSFMPPDGATTNPNVDNSILCVDFKVSAGETKEFKVDNTPPPGGRALTIGFWKNWASCAISSGKGQKPVLDQTMAAAEPTGIVVAATSGTYPAFGATLYLVLHDTDPRADVASDCLKAVRLLDKSTTNTGKKMASDPAFNLAAQLVAAELNYTALSGKTGAATTAIIAAVRLLGSYQFNGVTHTTISAADAALMNQYAKTLDDYNNNR
jgi:hypothetical protein